MSISLQDAQHLAKARAAAATSRHRYRVGAVVVVASRILGTSPNIFKNDPRCVDAGQSTVHAECGALRQAARSKGGTVYVARLLANGSDALAMPCPRCLVVLVGAGVQRAVWTTDGRPTSARLRTIGVPPL